MGSAPTWQAMEICAERTTGGRANGASCTEMAALPQVIHVEMAGTANVVPVIEGEPQRIWAAMPKICDMETECAALARGDWWCSTAPWGVLAAGLPSYGAFAASSGMCGASGMGRGLCSLGAGGTWEGIDVATSLSLRGSGVARQPKLGILPDAPGLFLPGTGELCFLVFFLGTSDGERCLVQPGAGVRCAPRPR